MATIQVFHQEGNMCQSITQEVLESTAMGKSGADSEVLRTNLSKFNLDSPIKCYVRTGFFSRSTELIMVSSLFKFITEALILKEKTTAILYAHHRAGLA
jgi:hypothetical protein